MPFLDLFDKPIAGWSAVLKAIEDRILAALRRRSPRAVMLAAVALAVQASTARGLSIFKQKRYGFNNELIEVYKFRSMYADRARRRMRAEARRPATIRASPVSAASSAGPARRAAAALQRAEGRAVAGRPAAACAHGQGATTPLYADIVEGYFARHKVKPGITGWAQVNGWRGETDTPEKIQRRVEYDLYYIENWSLLFDLYILARTPFALLDTENAY